MGSKLVKHMNNISIAAKILNIDIEGLDVHEAYKKVNVVLSNEDSFKEAMLKVEPIKASYPRALVMMNFFGLELGAKHPNEEQVIEAANKYLDDFKNKVLA